MAMSERAPRCICARRSWSFRKCCWVITDPLGKNWFGSGPLEDELLMSQSCNARKQEDKKPSGLNGFILVRVVHGQFWNLLSVPNSRPELLSLIIVKLNARRRSWLNPYRLLFSQLISFCCLFLLHRENSHQKILPSKIRCWVRW